ncbi:hypothetical protein Plhal304r1_c040g0118281 [Plasmopara halstedii]
MFGITHEEYFCRVATIVLAIVAMTAHVPELCGPTRHAFDVLEAGSTSDHTIAFHTHANILETRPNGTEVLYSLTFAAAQLKLEPTKVVDIKAIPVNLAHRYTSDGKLTYRHDRGKCRREVFFSDSIDSVGIGAVMSDMCGTNLPKRVQWYVPRTPITVFLGDLYPILEDVVVLFKNDSNDHVYQRRVVTQVVTAINARLTVGKVLCRYSTVCYLRNNFT